MANQLEAAATWTVERQAAVVLRLLQGEPIEAVSQQTGVPVSELESWRRVFLKAAASALRRYSRRVRKQASRERRRREAEPDRSEFAQVPPHDPAASALPVPAHLHYLWVTLGLDDE